jgi:hypothetical protein
MAVPSFNQQSIEKSQGIRRRAKVRMMKPALLKHKKFDVRLKS